MKCGYNPIFWNKQKSIVIITALWLPCDWSFVRTSARGYAATWPQQLLKVPKVSKDNAGGEEPSEELCCRYLRFNVWKYYWIDMYNATGSRDIL